MTVAWCHVCGAPVAKAQGKMFFPYCPEHQPSPLERVLLHDSERACGCGDCYQVRRARIESGECEDCGCLECECDENARRRAEDRLEAAHDDMRAERDGGTT